MTINVNNIKYHLNSIQGEANFEYNYLTMLSMISNESKFLNIEILP